MMVTEEMRLERALAYLEDDKARTERDLKRLEVINLREIIILRNRKHMYLADIDQMIRTAKAKLQEVKMIEKVRAEERA